MALKEELKKIVPAKLHAELPRSYDVIGSREKAVAIIELSDGLLKYGKKIAAALMAKNKNVKSVLLKASPRKGAFRLRSYRLLAGDKDTEVLHKESGMRLRLDPQKVFFSPREGTERMAAAQLAKKGETVMVFFAGVGPYAILISRLAKAKRIIGIEINPKGVDFFRQNIALNKCDNVEAVEGDVREAAKEFYGKCNRLYMPCAEGFDYIREALRCMKKGGTLHFYCVSKESELKSWVKKVQAAAKHEDRSAKMTGHRLVLPWGPRIWKVRIDFKVA
jgi:tRNA (guanine37-N1)-methyltransferase